MIPDPRTGSGDLWILDLARDSRTRFVSGATDDSGPVWSPDGRRLSYFSCCEKEDEPTLHIKDAGDTGKGPLPIKDQRFIAPQDWSQDGRFIIYRRTNRNFGSCRLSATLTLRIYSNSILRSQRKVLTLRSLGRLRLRRGGTTRSLCDSLR
jgi:hypothetical protein